MEKQIFKNQRKAVCTATAALSPACSSKTCIRSYTHIFPRKSHDTLGQ